MKTSTPSTRDRKFECLGLVICILCGCIEGVNGTKKIAHGRKVATSEVLLGMDEPIKSFRYVSRPTGCVAHCIEYPSVCRMFLYNPLHGKCDIIGTYYLINNTNASFNETVIGVSDDTVIFIVTCTYK